MPDNSVLTIKGAIRYGGPELLFDPSLDGMTCDSFHGIALKSINESDIDVRKELCKNIIMSGGSTMFDGINERLSNELKAALPAGSDVRIVAEPTRKYSVWRGASTLSSLTTFDESWVSKADFEEHGFAILHR